MQRVSQWWRIRHRRWLINNSLQVSLLAGSKNKNKATNMWFYLLYSGGWEYTYVRVCVNVQFGLWKTNLISQPRGRTPDMMTRKSCDFCSQISAVHHLRRPDNTHLWEEKGSSGVQRSGLGGPERAGFYLTGSKETWKTCKLPERTTWAPPGGRFQVCSPNRNIHSNSA